MNFTNKTIPHIFRNKYLRETGSFKSSGSIVVNNNGSGNSTTIIAGEYLPATRNEDGTYTVDVSSVKFQGNVVASGEVIAHKEGSSLSGDGSYVTVIDSLTSDSTTDALSAAQGKILNEKIESITVGDNYYTKDEINDKLSSVEVDLSYYYNKSETYSKEEIDQKIGEGGGNVDLSNYYKKSEVYNINETYNKEEIDKLIGSSGGGSGSDTDLSNYYTKEEVNAALPYKVTLDAYSRLFIETGLSYSITFFVKIEGYLYNRPISSIVSVDNGWNKESCWRVAKVHHFGYNFGSIYIYRDTRKSGFGASPGPPFGTYSIVLDPKIDDDSTGQDYIGDFEITVVYGNDFYKENFAKNVYSLGTYQDGYYFENLDYVEDIIQASIIDTEVNLSNYYSKEEINDLVDNITASGKLITTSISSPSKTGSYRILNIDSTKYYNFDIKISFKSTTGDHIHIFSIKKLEQSISTQYNSLIGFHYSNIDNPNEVKLRSFNENNTKLILYIKLGANSLDSDHDISIEVRGDGNFQIDRNELPSLNIISTIDLPFIYRDYNDQSYNHIYSGSLASTNYNLINSSNNQVPLVVDSLDGSSSQALSVTQGKILNEKIENITLGDNYYTKEEINDKLSSVEVDLSDYYNKSETYSKEEIDQKIEEGVDNVDLSDYYKKSEVYNINETYNKEEIDNLIGSSGGSGNDTDLSNYYTKEEVDQKIEDIEISNSTNYNVVSFSASSGRNYKIFSISPGGTINFTIQSSANSGDSCTYSISYIVSVGLKIQKLGGYTYSDIGIGNLLYKRNSETGMYDICIQSKSSNTINFTSSGFSYVTYDTPSYITSSSGYTTYDGDRYCNIDIPNGIKASTFVYTKTDGTRQDLIKYIEALEQRIAALESKL